MENKEYYLATTNDKGEFIVYTSEPFKLTELEIIKLIKICMIECRDKTIGKRILSAYRDSTNDRIALTEQRLNDIGIKANGKPEIKSRRTKTR